MEFLAVLWERIYFCASFHVLIALLVIYEIFVMVVFKNFYQTKTILFVVNASVPQHGAI